MPSLLFSASAPPIVNTFTRRVRVRLRVSVRIMVNHRDRVRYVVRVRGTCPLIHPNYIFPVRVRVSTVARRVYKQ